jgi:hypothetical protein
MKKLLTLFTLLLTVCSGAWADETVTIFDGVTATSKTDASGTTYKSGTEYTNATTGFKYTCKGFKTDLVDVSAYTNHGSYNKAMRYGGSGASSYNVQFVVPSGYTADITVVYGLQSNATKYIGISTSTSASANGSNCTEWNASITANTTLYSYTKENLAGGKTYYLLANSDKAVIAKLEVTLKPSAPTISAQPQDANYVEGTSAGDVTALSVTATGTGDLYYQWFSNTSKSTTGAVSVQDKSKADGANTYKPSAATSGTTYYYCAVTDDNGTTNSDFATVVVSAASAPTSIEISGDNSAARGADDITLTADVTGGVPTPTIEWFKCDDALKTNPVSQGEASTSNTTLNVATTTVGTYYYYAVASNSQGNVASNVKTITIVPQAPTLTAGGYFSGDSKSVEIAKATGEDAAAVIKYSTDNGESWSDYSEALSLTATTTVKAKVVQSGLESAEVSATYTKFTPSTITEVNAITTWDWTGWDQTLELKNDGTTNPSSTDDYTFDDIAAINGGITVPASFNGAAMKFKGEYPVRSKKSQAGYWTIKPSVNGTITVTFSDTGSSIQKGYTTETQPKRYLNINGTNTDYYTKRTGNSTDKKAVTVPVSAGEVVITGMGEDGETWQAIVVEKIIFTPTATVTTNKGGWTSFTPSWNATLEDGATAYIITSIDGANNSVEATAVSVMESGKGYFIKGDNAETEYIVTATSTAATPTEGNLIVGNTSATTISATSPTTTDKYVLGTATAGTYSGQSGLFKVDSSVNVAAGKAYLDTQTTVSAQYLSIAWDDDMTTTIDNFTISQFDKNATRYNLAGQKVSDSYKGIVIVNGKKYLCK